MSKRIKIDPETGDAILDPVTGDAIMEGDSARRPAGTAEDPFTDVRQLTDRYPDNPEASKLYNNPEEQSRRVVEGQKQAYREGSSPLGRAAAGAGRFAYSFVPGKKAGMEREAFDQASAGDIPTLAGRLAPDIAASMAGGAALSGATGAARIVSPTLRSLAQGAAYGAPSTVLHQAQNLTEGRGLDPKAAAVEMGVSTALPVVGNRVGQWLRGQGPAVLRSATKPVLNQMDTPNPPNFEAALERNLVPYRGGLEASQERARAAVQGLGAQRDAAAAAASTLPGSRVPTVRVPFVQGALQDAQDDIARQMQNPRTQMLTNDLDEAQQALNFWEREFAHRTSARGGNLSVEDALAFRQRIDDEISWRVANQANTPGFERASTALRRSLNERIEQAAPEVGQTTRELADVVPYEQALARRNMQAGNNYRFGLLDAGAMGAGGVIGAAGGLTQDHPGSGAAMGALGLLAGRRLFSTPGGAAMLFDAGRSLTQPSTTRNLAMQTLRTAGNDANNRRPRVAQLMLDTNHLSTRPRM